MNDIECPYCEADNEINHDDGYGYAEDEVFEQECRTCGKVFVYTTYTSFHYDVEKAPCKNGEEHKWKPMVGFPEEYFIDKYRCECCGEEKVIKNKVEIAITK